MKRVVRQQSKMLGRAHLVAFSDIQCQRTKVSGLESKSVKSNGDETVANNIRPLA